MTKQTNRAASTHLCRLVVVQDVCDVCDVVDVVVGGVLQKLLIGGGVLQELLYGPARQQHEFKE